MSRLLTPAERELPREERRALRRARKLEKWPDTNGRPPWLVRTEGVLSRLGQRAILIIANAAGTAVLNAAAATLAGGQARHEFAVAALVAVAASEAIDLARKDAAGIIADTFELFVDDGDL